MANSLRRTAAAVATGLWSGIKELAWGVYRHDAVGLAMQIAYSFLFSLFPFLLFLRALVAYFPSADRIGDELLKGLADLVTTDSRLYEIVENSIFNEIAATSSALLSIGILLTLWSASGAAMTLFKAINRAYSLRETRSWQRRRLMATGVAIGGAVVIPLGMLVLFFGEWIGGQIAAEWGGDSLVHRLWSGLHWPGIVILLIALVGGFMYIAPARRQRWYAVLPGAVFSVAAIIGSSLGLSLFLTQNIFQVRWLTWGAIGTVIVLLFWAFLAGLMLLVGTEINAVVRRMVQGRERRRARVSGFALGPGEDAGVYETGAGEDADEADGGLGGGGAAEPECPPAGDREAGEGLVESSDDE